jgi:hypothetical protein
MALEALAVARDALPAHSHPCGLRTFTQHQLFACLVLMRLFKSDYRGIAAILVDCSNLRDAIVLHCDAVAKPVAVRHAWANNPACNLYNKEGLPASPFRTDDW